MRTQLQEDMMSDDFPTDEDLYGEYDEYEMKANRRAAKKRKAKKMGVDGAGLRDTFRRLYIDGKED
jgi:hypothetical protein